MKAKFLICSLLLSLHCPASEVSNNATNEVYQYFVPGPEGKNYGAYLWVPPDTPVIRAVMVGIHNGLPLTILQYPAVRKVCAEFGIAQVLLTPYSSDLGMQGMLKNMNFDVTDPARTTVYDKYIKALAETSGHPELALAPVIPLAHSAWCSFPFDVAMRDHARCLMAIPIKAGWGSIYPFYAQGGKSMKPAPELTMESVPILFCTSMNQVTAPGNWKTKPLPFSSGSGGGPVANRDDKDDNSGTAYQRGNELFGYNWEMLSCHFDMSTREYDFIAKYLAAVSKARLPDPPPAPGILPTLKPMTLSSGWLVDPYYSNYGKTNQTYYQAAPYAQYKGPKNRAWWYPTEELAREMEQRMIEESAKKFEAFTIKDKNGDPISLADSPQVKIPNPLEYLEKDGLFTLKVQPLTCSTSAATNAAQTNNVLLLPSTLFPGVDKIPVSSRPVKVDLNGGALELLPGTDFTFRIRPHRLSPEPGGIGGACLRFYKEGDKDWAWIGLNVMFSWWPNGQKIPGIKDQKITFPAIADAPKSTARIKLAATSDSGLPVGYFVQQGPAVVEDDELVITQVPIKDPKPIKVTVGAYQVGLWQKDGFRAAPTVYQSFSLLP